MAQLLFHKAAALAATVVLAACTNLESDRSSVDGSAQLPMASSFITGIPPAIQAGSGANADITALLKAPLDADTAVRIALLNNPGLQISLSSDGANVPGYMPVSEISSPKARQDVARLAAQTRKAWVSAVAAAQVARHLADAKEALEAGGELARRMVRAGNWSRLRQAREQLLLAEAAIQLAQAQQVAFDEREKLVVFMGLWGDQIQFQLADRLPELPAQPQNLPDVESRAMRERLDLRQAAAQGQNPLAASRKGVSEAQGHLLGESAQLREMAVQARSEARRAYHTYRTAYDLARHYRNEIVPLQRFIGEEGMLRYNGMLASVWEVLSDSRAQMLSASRAIEALRDFWQAEADLQALLAGVPLPIAGVRPAAASSPAASTAAH